jgi:hypothetical protein
MFIKRLTCLFLTIFIGNAAETMEPYDITPYKEKSNGELYQLVEKHDVSPYRDDRDWEEKTTPFKPDQDWVDRCYACPDVDEDWKIMITAYQALIKRREYERHSLDTTFHTNRFILRGEGGQKEGTLDLQKSLLFYWKRVGWVNPLDASALGYALTHGFEDKVMINLKWGELWFKRAALLRSRKRQWYIPQDSNMFPSVSRYGSRELDRIQQFYQLIKRLRI